MPVVTGRFVGQHVDMIERCILITRHVLMDLLQMTCKACTLLQLFSLVASTIEKAISLIFQTWQPAVV